MGDVDELLLALDLEGEVEERAVYNALQLLDVDVHNIIEKLIENNNTP